MHKTSPLCSSPLPLASPCHPPDACTLHSQKPREGEASESADKARACVYSTLNFKAGMAGRALKNNQPLETSVATGGERSRPLRDDRPPPLSIRRHPPSPLPHLVWGTYIFIPSRYDTLTVLGRGEPDRISPSFHFVCLATDFSYSSCPVPATRLWRIHTSLLG
jgi:hypothetical protein